VNGVWTELTRSSWHPGLQVFFSAQPRHLPKHSHHHRTAASLGTFIAVFHR
jgi:hypothetical protein